MHNMTAAYMARLNATLARTIRLDDEYTTWRDLIDSDRIAYGRERTYSDGKRAYGVILREDAEAAHGSDAHDSYADALAYTSFTDAPKSVVDYLRTVEYIATVTITPDGATINRDA